MVRIDAHLHVFASASEQFPREPDDLAPAGRAEPVEKFIGCMEEHGIDQAMLVQMGGASIAHHASARVRLVSHTSPTLEACAGNRSIVL